MSMPICGQFYYSVNMLPSHTRLRCILSGRYRHYPIESQILHTWDSSLLLYQYNYKVRTNKLFTVTWSFYLLL